MSKVLPFPEPTSPEGRYMLYVRYCHRVEVKPLSFEDWMRESETLEWDMD
jgi:hypothetical protein